VVLGCVYDLWCWWRQHHWQGVGENLESANWRETHGKRFPATVAAPAVAPAKASRIFSLPIHATVSWLHANMPLLD
jgi:hypothetical protein